MKTSGNEAEFQIGRIEIPFCNLPDWLPNVVFRGLCQIITKLM